MVILSQVHLYALPGTHEKVQRLGDYTLERPTS